MMKNFTALSVSAAVVGLTAFSFPAQAAIVTVPTDLNRGDQYRLMFVTDAVRDATSSNIADYNAFVTNDVVGSALQASLTANGLNPTWFAIGSTATIDARDNTGTNPNSSTGVPIYRIDGYRVFDNNLDLWTSDPEQELVITPSAKIIESYVWTGTWFGGEVSSAGLGDVFDAVLVGQTNWFSLGPTSWIESNFFSQFAYEFPLYAISSELTCMVCSERTPEPSTILGFITLGGLMLLRGSQES